MLAEWYVDPETLSRIDEGAAEWFGNTEKHLELILIRFEPVAANEIQRFGNKLFIMRGYTDVRPALEKDVQEFNETPPNLLAILIGDLRWLDVDTFA